MIPTPQDEFEKPLKQLLSAPMRLVWVLLQLAARPAGIALLLALVGFSSYSAYSANHRLGLIETALGGQERLRCTRQATIERVRPSIVRIVGGAGEGSGFILNEGFIVTNYHVIAGEPSPKVVYHDDVFETGEVFAVDTEADLALIRVYRERMPALDWSTREPQAGEEVLAMGFPLGGELGGELTVNTASVAGKRALDTEGRPSFIQIGGGLVEGMSGGPTVSQCGEVVGVNVSAYNSGAIGLLISAGYAHDSINFMMMNPSYEERGIARINFQPDASPVDTVSAYYNYLKVRNFKEAYKLLSPRFVGSVTYDTWRDGFAFSLDTSILDIQADKKVPGRVLVNLGSTDLIDGQFIYRTFEGAWLVKKEDGHYKLWESNIKETTDLN